MPFSKYYTRIVSWAWQLTWSSTIVLQYCHFVGYVIWPERTLLNDEKFHFEIFKNFMKILKYFKTLFLKYFMKLLIFNIKWLKTFKNMIKVYQVSRRYIMLFMHNNKYLPLTGLLTLPQWTIHNTACTVTVLYSAKYFDIYGVKWLKQANQANQVLTKIMLKIPWLCFLWTHCASSRLTIIQTKIIN